MIRTLITRWLDPLHIEQISEVEGIDLDYRPELVATPTGRDALFYTASRLPAPSRLERDEHQEDAWRVALQRAEVMFDIDPLLGEDVTVVAPRLRWIQTVASGVEAYFASFPGLANSNVQLIPARGVHSGPLADFAVMAILQHAKNLKRLNRAKSNRTWDEFASRPLDRTQACIVGYGHIGRSVAARLIPFGISVTGVKRLPSGDDGTVRIVGCDKLENALSIADWVILSLPANDQTYHLIDQQAIASLKPGAYLVNVGRGSTIDEVSLIEALNRGHISGAALDVFEVEPLGESSALWGTENVIVSAHSTAFNGHASMQRIVDMFCENLRRDVAGKPLLTAMTQEGSI
jgi:phosphoglycerate dehydrogenase-like enzyme